jgi:hypothetical protein
MSENIREGDGHFCSMQAPSRCAVSVYIEGPIFTMFLLKHIIEWFPTTGWQLPLLSFYMMAPPTPADVKTTSPLWPNTESSSNPSLRSSPTELYIPLHKRKGNQSAAVSKPSSPTTTARRSLSLPCSDAIEESNQEARKSATSFETHTAFHAFHSPAIEGTKHPLVYTLVDLLLIARSPLSWPSQEQLTSLKDAAPEIMLNTTQRKALFSGNQDKQEAQVKRSRPGVRRRQYKRASESNWRGGRVTTSIITPLPVVHRIRVV